WMNRVQHAGVTAEPGAGDNVRDALDEFNCSAFGARWSSSSPGYCAYKVLATLDLRPIAESFPIGDSEHVRRPFLIGRKRFGLSGN
ncbi:MAG TPA: hypothetical protein PKM59_12700, partial [Thermodesulfobacteriota bacterium]|nr:hypothetical protein [Thermodesulfobacteriota bacterium]